MRIAILLLACLLLSSCATAISGRTENITVDSDPQGANVALTCADGMAQNGLTPWRATISRKADGCSIQVTKEGFSPQTVALEQRVNPTYWTNFVTSPLAIVGVVGFTGLLFSEPDDESRMVGTACLLTVGTAWITDYRTGAVWAHEPKAIRVVLKPE